jgi:hypothetical protein
MLGSEVRQAWKGATVITDTCAGVWLFGTPPLPGFESFRGWCILALPLNAVRHLQHVLSGFSAEMATPDISGNGRPGTCAAGLNQCPGS